MRKPIPLRPDSGAATPDCRESEDADQDRDCALAVMTSLAFILGVVPLADAVGAGAEMRQSLGAAPPAPYENMQCSSLQLPHSQQQGRKVRWAE